MESTSNLSNFLGFAGRVLLGLVVGASFGVVIGALIASWVYGVDAIEGEAVNASYLAAAVTVFGGVAGALIGLRVASNASSEPELLEVGVEQDSRTQQERHDKL